MGSSYVIAISVVIVATVRQLARNWRCKRKYQAEIEIARIRAKAID